MSLDPSLGGFLLLAQNSSCCAVNELIPCNPTSHLLYVTVTLDAYIDKYSSLVPFLADNASGTPASDLAPSEQISKAISLQVLSIRTFDIPDPKDHHTSDLDWCRF
jgi:hypothetical protein